MSKVQMEEITNYEESVDTRKVTKEEQIADLQEQVKSMTEKRNEKMRNARTHFLARLGTINDQWQTANGVLEALHVLREVVESQDYTYEISAAANIAKNMATNVCNFWNVVSDLEEVEWNENCGNLIEEQALYDPSFILKESNFDSESFAEELCMLRFCAMIGPDLDDCANFYNSATEEINNIQDKIAELKIPELKCTEE